MYIYIAFEFLQNFLYLIFGEKLNKTIDKLKTDLLFKYISGSDLQDFESVQLFMTESSPKATVKSA